MADLRTDSPYIPIYPFPILRPLAVAIGYIILLVWRDLNITGRIILTENSRNAAPTSATPSPTPDSPVPSPTTSPSSSTSSSSASNIALKAGLGAGIPVVILLIIAIVFAIVYRRRYRRATAPPPPQEVLGDIPPNYWRPTGTKPSELQVWAPPVEMDGRRTPVPPTPSPPPHSDTGAKIEEERGESCGVEETSLPVSPNNERDYRFGRII